MLLIYRLLGNGVFLGGIDATLRRPSCCVLNRLRDLAILLANYIKMKNGHTQYSLPDFLFHAGSGPTSSRRPSRPMGVTGISPFNAVLEGTKIGNNLV
jgi:hypothetical protein